MNKRYCRKFNKIFICQFLREINLSNDGWRLIEKRQTQNIYSEIYSFSIRTNIILSSHSIEDLLKKMDERGIIFDAVFQHKNLTIFNVLSYQRVLDIIKNEEYITDRPPLRTMRRIRRQRRAHNNEVEKQTGPAVMYMNLGNQNNPNQYDCPFREST